MSASDLCQFFLILSLFFTSTGGIVVASVLKEMDNVVKVRNSGLYTYTHKFEPQKVLIFKNLKVVNS